jgi:hypothetical protein
VIFGKGAALSSGDDVVGDAGDLRGLVRIDREGWDGMNFDHRKRMKVAVCTPPCLIGYAGR